MKKLTYYIGAGASFQSLPLQADMSERLKLFLLVIENQSKGRQDESEFSQILKKFRVIADEVRKSTSLDAYAKEQWNSNNPSSKETLRYIKVLLSSFLIFEQFEKPIELVGSFPEGKDLALKTNTLLDSRYRTFWASLLNQNQKLPDSVRVISWNYDLQFEISFANQANILFQDSVMNLARTENSLGEPWLTKLNGTAGLFWEDERDIHPMYDFRSWTPRENIGQLITIIIAGCRGHYTQPYINFGWENDPPRKKSIEIAKQIVMDTTDLVIIGYSFPQFNHEIDKQILSESSNLRNIYYQTIEQDYNEQLERLVEIDPGHSEICKLKKDIRTFFVPPGFP
jgi:hypothetical protein